MLEILLNGSKTMAIVKCTDAQVPINFRCNSNRMRCALFLPLARVTMIEPTMSRDTSTSNRFLNKRFPCTYTHVQCIFCKLHWILIFFCWKLTLNVRTFIFHEIALEMWPFFCSSLVAAMIISSFFYEFSVSIIASAHISRTLKTVYWTLLTVTCK